MIGICSGCNQSKELPYTKHRNYFCRPCMRKRRKEFWQKAGVREKYTARVHGLSPSQYRNMLEAQENKCAICRCDLEKTYIDHVSGTWPHKVRGILCNRCNAGLGHFSHNPEHLRNAAEYLEKADANQIRSSVPLDASSSSRESEGSGRAV